MNRGIEGSIISVPDGPTLAAHEISTLSFTQAFAIYKVPLLHSLQESAASNVDASAKRAAPELGVADETLRLHA